MISPLYLLGWSLLIVEPQICPAVVKEFFFIWERILWSVVLIVSCFVIICVSSLSITWPNSQIFLELTVHYSNVNQLSPHPLFLLVIERKTHTVLHLAKKPECLWCWQTFQCSVTVTKRLLLQCYRICENGFTFCNSSSECSVDYKVNPAFLLMLLFADSMFLCLQIAVV